MKIWSWVNYSENFTKWRLDDVINEGQGWKRYALPCLYMPIHMCAKFYRYLIEPFSNDLAHKKVVRNKKNKLDI